MFEILLSTGKSIGVPGEEVTPLTNHAIIFGGYNLTAQQKSVQAFDYSNDSLISGNDLADTRSYSAGIGNYDRAVIAGGNVNGSSYSDTTVIFVFTNQVSISGASLGTAVTGSRGASNNTTGIFVGGITVSSSRTGAIDQYTFSSNTIVRSTKTITPRTNMASLNGPTGGHFVAGLASSMSTVHEIVDYSGSTITNGTALSPGRDQSASCNNNTKGYVAGGSDGSTSANIATTSVYTFSSKVWTTVTSYDTRKEHTGTGNPTTGIIVGGHTTTNTDGHWGATLMTKLNYSNNTSTKLSTLMAPPVRSSAGVSSQPGVW